MIKRIGSLLSLKEREPTWDYPWPQWIFCFIVLICNIYLSYIIYYYRIRTPWMFGVNIFIYWITFFVLYISEIEKLTVDKKVI